MPLWQELSFMGSHKVLACSLILSHFFLCFKLIWQMNPISVLCTACNLTEFDALQKLDSFIWINDWYMYSQISTRKLGTSWSCECHNHCSCPSVLHVVCISLVQILPKCMPFSESLLLLALRIFTIIAHLSPLYMLRVQVFSLHLPQLVLEKFHVLKQTCLGSTKVSYQGSL